MKYTALLLGLIFAFPVNAQYKMNFGLREKQQPSELPRSNARVVFPSPVDKAPSKTELNPVHQGEWIISGGWRLLENNMLIASGQSLFQDKFNGGYDATVPGTVLTTLVDQGVYPDPYYGINNTVIPDSLCRTDWWYRVSFNTPEETVNKRIWLLFNGINYKADIWLNGRLIGSIQGAFKRGEFDITEFAQTENNILAVHIFPPPNPGIPHEESPRSGQGPNGGQLCLDGPTFISSEGWDWIPGIRDRNIGIWQDVRLRMTGDVTLIDPQIITDLSLPDTSTALISIKMEVKNQGSSRQKVTIGGTLEGAAFSQELILDPGQKTRIKFTPEKFSQLKIINPRLWWPNGYGKPDLYEMQVTVKDETGTVSDFTTIRFGIREFTYELSVDTRDKQNQRIEFNPLGTKGHSAFDNIKRRDVGEGVAVPVLKDDYEKEAVSLIDNNAMTPYLVIKVNGVPVFCKGGNWGMDDGMKRVNRDRIEPYFRLHRDAGFTMIRNWTGESTEELFYDLADEYGLLVWNDFWLSTEGYNLEVNDNQLFMDNATDVVRRFRNHPSVVIWCPRNEGYATPEMEPQLAELIAREDGTRHYHANSRYLNLRPSGPWHYFKDPADYFRNNAFGFNTEQGTPSIPTAASMRKMMAPEDVWPISDVWYYHDLHDGQKDYVHAINTLYGPSSDLETFCSKAQMVNYDSHRAMFEAWNSRLWNNTSGLLLWMTHPAWPSTVWQVYSWDYETFGSYFGSKKACEPVHVQMNLHDNRVVAINTTKNELVNAKVKLEYYDLNGKRFFNKEISKNIAANTLTYCMTPDSGIVLPAVYLVRVTLATGKKIISLNDYWKKNFVTNDFTAFNNTGKIKPVISPLMEKKSESGYSLEFTIKNTDSKPMIALKLNASNPVTGDLILPAYFSDGYFNLLPGEQKRISLRFPKKPEHSIQIVVDGYNIL